MPHIPAMPPASRVYARLDRFEVSCPSCGTLIQTAKDGRRQREAHNKTLAQATPSRQRVRAVETPRSASVWKLVWNPYTQRLHCRRCGSSYTVGLVLLSIPKGRRILTAPPDTLATAHERAEMRRLGGGWHLEQYYEADQPVNLVVSTPCTCPVRGWEPTCAVHGDPAAGTRA